MEVLDAAEKMPALRSRLLEAHELLQRSRGQAVELTGDELGTFPDTPEGLKELRAAAREFLKTLRGKWVDCPALGRKVEIRNRSIGEMLAFSANPLKLRAIAGIEHILRTAGEPEREANHKPHKVSALAYYRLRARVRIAGHSVTLVVVIEEDVHGLLHYDLMVQAKTKAALDSSVAAFEPTLTHDHNPWSAGTEIVAGDSSAVNDPAAVLDSAAGLVLNLFIVGEDAIPVLDAAVLDRAGEGASALEIARRASLASRLLAATQAYSAATGAVARLRAAQQVRELLEELGATSQESPHLVTLRAVAAGQRDDQTLAELYGLIQEAVNGLEEAGELAGEAESLAHAAITRWAELEEKTNA